MSFEKLKLKRILLACASAILAFALVLGGAIMLSGTKDMSRVYCQVLSTDNGEYYNTSNGGRVFIDGTSNGSTNNALGVNNGAYTTLTAVPNDGYGFAGFYDEEETKLLSLEESYTFQVTESTNVVAKFAKLYPISLTLEDPFQENAEITINKLCYVGECVSTYDFVNEFYGEEYAVHFQNSTAAPLNQNDVYDDFILAQSAIVVGAEAADLKIQPTDPQSLGANLPSGYTKESQYLFLHSAPGVQSFAIKDYMSYGFFPKEEKTDYKVYYYFGFNSTWCYFDPLEFDIKTNGKYIVTGIQMHYYNMEKYYDANLNWTYVGWTSYFDATQKGIYSDEVGAVQIEIQTAEGMVATFYEDSSNVLEQVTYPKNSTYSMPNTLPEKEGFTFAGWTNNKESNVVSWSSGTKTITKDVVWYPVWERKNVLTYNYLNSSMQKVTVNDSNSTQALFSCVDAYADTEYFDIQPVPNKHFTYQGKTYDFIGYALDNTANTVYGSIEDVDGLRTSVEIEGKQIKLYGVYRTTLNISYDPTWGYDPPVDGSAFMYKIAGSTGVLSPAATYKISEVKPVNDQGTFKGWLYNKKLYNAEDTITISTDISLVAKWEFFMILTGKGTYENPYTISTVGELQSFMSCVNDGRYSTEFFKLLNDIEIEALEPIGYYDTLQNKTFPFKGVFDGGGHTITVNINLPTQDYIGLFGYNEGTIQNLNIAGSLIGKNYVGSICGYNTGIISSCQSTATVKGLGNYIGGIVGANNGAVQQLYSKGQVTGIAETLSSALGGVIGQNNIGSVARNIINEAIVSANNYQWVGGIAGQNSGSIENFYNAGNVSGASYVGGIVGQNGEGVVVNGYNIGTITSLNAFVAAIAGATSGEGLQYLYYFKNSAHDSQNIVQKSIGVANVGESLEEDPEAVQAIEGQDAETTVIMQDGTERSLLWALNVGIEFFADSTGGSYCNWVEVSNKATIIYNNEWTATSGSGSATLGWTGTGTLYDPYQIGAVGDILLLTEKVNLGITYKNSYFKMTYDIDFASYEEDWTPIGGYNGILGKIYAFEGTFNGGGNAILNLNLSLSSNYVGLFGYSSGIIQNLTMKDCKISGKEYVGSVVGYNAGKVINCTNQSEVDGAKYVGGVVGYNAGLIDKTVHSGHVKINKSSTQYIGGLTGFNNQDGVIRNSYSTGKVTAQQNTYVGGLVGQNEGKILNSFNQGATNAGSYVGGIAGYNNKGTVQNAYVTGAVVGTNNYAGAVLGANTEGNLKFLYYKENIAKDANIKVQNGIGHQTKGSATADDKKIFTVFDEEASFDTIKINNQYASTLIWGLNLGHQYLSNLENNIYITWTQEAGELPILISEGVWNDTTFWMFDGHGTELNPFLIKTQADLEYLSLYVNMGNSYEGQYFRLENDIQYVPDEIGWLPIGYYDEALNAKIMFSGVFDGNYHKIDKLETCTSRDYFGFFGISNGVIKNLGISNALLYGNNYVGGICGYNLGTIENCYSNSLIMLQENYGGGIAGINEGRINKCYNLFAVSGANESYGEGLGGIVGINKSGAQIYNTFSYAVVTGEVYNNVGGIAGVNEGAIVNVSVSASALSEGAFYVGGIVGKNLGRIECAYNTGSVKSINYYSGAISGVNNGIIKNTFYYENAAVDGDGTFQKGLGSDVSGTIKQDNLKETAPFKDSAEMYENFYVEGTLVEIILEAMLASHAIISAEEDDKYIVWRDDDNVWYPVIYELGEPPLTWLTTNTKAAFNGEGTIENPYTISNVADLNTFVAYVNAGRSFAGEYVSLTANLEFNGSQTNQWVAIGQYDAQNQKSNYFAGTFDGNGYTISGVYIDKTTNYQGVFGYSTGTIKNLTVEGTIIGGSYVGGIAGYSTGTIVNCVNKCTVKGRGSYIGGIVGGSNGKIEKCYTTGNVSGTNTTDGRSVGGIVGINLTGGSISTSFTVAKVSASNYQWVGGVAGQNHGDVFNCYSADDVTGSNYVGGVVGQNAGGKISNAVSYGKVNGSNTYVGGVVGVNTEEGKMEYTYYLAGNATDGNKNVQGGIGQEKMGEKVADSLNMYMEFSKQLKIETTNIQGKKVETVLDALNVFALSERQNGRANDTWLKNASGYPAFGFNNVWDGMSSSPYSAGNGTKENPYQIDSANELNYLQQQSSMGETYKNTYFVLTNDIYLNNISITSRDANVNVWTPIQDFAGNFDGQNYAVHGMFIANLSDEETEVGSEDYKGLFGNVTGIISNVCAFDGYIEGFQFVGSIAGASEGSITNCYSNNTIKAYGNFVGGIVGQIYGILNACGNYGSIEANGNYVGGVAGKSTNTILNTYNLGTVTSEGESVGGIVGVLGNAKIANCFNTGAVVGTTMVGGLVGDNSSVMTNCYNSGKVTASKNFVGSLIGKNTASLNTNFYLLASASCGSVMQGAVGSEQNTFVSNQTTKATAFNSKFMIPATRIGGVEVDDFVEALNAQVQQSSVIDGVALFKWEMSTNNPVYKRFWQGGLSTKFSGGDGTEINPYQITSSEELTYLASRVNNGEDFFSKYFVLKNDIVLNDETFVFEKDSGLVKVSDGANVAYLGTGILGEFAGESEEFDNTASSVGTWYANPDGYTGKYTGNLYEWSPIGTVNEQTGGTCDFAGFFDGNGYVISGLYINSNKSTMGLFGQVSGVVKNIGITNSYIAGNTYVGGIAGYNLGTITNVFNDAVVVGKTSSVGGICGFMAEASVLSNTYSTGQTFGPEKSGKLVGELYGKIENAYSYGLAVVEENRAKLFGQTSQTASTTGVYVWGGSALAETFTEVTTENYGDAVSALNQKATEKDWYKWSINSQTGMPQFITKVIWDGQISYVDFAGGDGSKEKPYLISNATQLAKFASIALSEIHAKLTNDIYLNDETFEFIADSGLVKVTDGKNVAYFGTGIKGLSGGTNTKFDNVPSTRGVWYTNDNGTEGTYKGTLNTWTAIENLKGSFDGNGYTIFGMYSLSSFIDTMKGDIKNLTVANSLTYNQTMAAGLVQTFNGGKIENCTNLGIVIGGDAAGLIGKVTSDITTTKDHKEAGYTSIYVVTRTSIVNSRNLGVIAGINVGGIVGYGEFIEKIEDCFNVGSINATNKAGGIIYAYNGRFEEMGKTFTISNCHNYAEIIGKDYTAGILANLVGGQEKVEDKSTYKPSKILISNVSNSSKITGSAYSAGIIAYADKQSAEEIKIVNATNSGDVTGLNYTGGVAGRITYAILENVSNAGGVQGVTSTGGVIGYGAVSITEAENTGSVSGLNNVGGIMGYLYDSNHTIKNVYNFASVMGTGLVGGIVGKLTSNANIESAYTSSQITGTHSVGGIAGVADSGSIKQSYVACSVEGDYFVGGIIGNEQGSVAYTECFYPYGLVNASSSAEKEQTGIGVAVNAAPNDDPNGISKYAKDMALCVKGSMDVDDIQTFLTSAKVEEKGAAMFVVDNKDNYCMLDGQIIVPSNYGINPSSGKAIILAYKAKATVTLYANGQGEILGSENGWSVTYQGQTASKVLYANSPIGEMPMMYDDFYTFDGWYVDSECLGQKITSASVYDFSYTKLYAKWIIETFTITINTEGLCKIPETSGWWLSDDKYSATKHLTSLDAVGKLPVLEIDGYTFEGWFIDPEFNYRISPSSLFWAREDTTMYPKLTPNTLELSIRLNDVEWLNSNINIGVYKVVDSTETLVWSMENIQDSSVTVDKALEKGFYKVYASRKADKLTELYQIGAITYVEGMVNFVIDYYSLTLTRGDVGINSVYISEENDVYINGQDIHNNAQIYLRGQSVVISAVVAEGNGYAWSAWVDALTGDRYSTSQDLEIESIDQSFVLTASTN